jgi:hypothetical protein
MLIGAGLLVALIYFDIFSAFDTCQDSWVERECGGSCRSLPPLAFGCPQSTALLDQEVFNDLVNSGSPGDDQRRAPAATSRHTGNVRIKTNGL